MGDRHPAKFKAPARAASPLVASKPLLVADARQAMEHVERAERERTGEPAPQEARGMRSTADGSTADATPERAPRTASPRKTSQAPAPGTPVRIAVVPHLTTTAAAIYESLPAPERDRDRWLANLVRAGFVDWSKRVLADGGKQRLAAERLREPRRTYVPTGRLAFQTTAERIAALRDAAADTLKVYPDAAVAGVWVAIYLEEELAAQVRR